MKATFIDENLLYFKPTELNENLVKNNTFSRKKKKTKNVWLNTWAPYGATKLTKNKLSHDVFNDCPFQNCP